MSTLGVSVDFGFDETIVSFTSRLAAANRVGTLQFCQHMGLSYEALAAGDVVAISRLMKLAGRDLDAGRYRSVVYRSRQLQEVGGEILRKPTFIQHGQRYCPLCVADDIENGRSPRISRAYARLSWSVGVIRTCLRHEVSLLRANYRRPYTIAEVTHILSDNVARIDLAKVLRPAPRTEFEEYVDGRLWGRFESRRWIDGLELHDAITMCERVGEAMVFGAEQITAGITEFQRSEAVDVGYRLLGSGDGVLEKFLGNLHRDYWAGGSHLEKRGRYKKFCGRLGYDEADPVFGLIYAVAMEVAPVARSDRFGGLY